MSLLYRLLGRFPTLLIAKRNISRAKIRSLLAAMSILIGVVAIGAIGGGGVAFKQSQMQTLQGQGATNVFVAPGLGNDKGYLDQEDVKAINATVGSADVVATKSQEMVVPGRGSSQQSVRVTYLDNPRALYSVSQGTIPGNWRRTAVLSNDYATENRVQIGDRIVLASEEDVTDTRPYRVTAIITGTQGFGAGEVLLPLAEAPNREYSQLRVTTMSANRAQQVADQLRSEFNGRSDHLLVLELTSLIRLLQQIVNGINAFLAGLAAISLVVAGVSITNTMLMAVIKRREEIGVLRSVGYQRRDIIRILLVEAALLGVIGALIGAGIALGIVMGINSLFLGSPFAFSSQALAYIVIAALFGTVMSVIAGVYPAWRAANERPVETLRG